MADVDDGHSLRFQIPDDLEQKLHFVHSQRSGGLVHDQDLRVLAHGFCDLHDLHLGGAHGPHDLIRVQLNAQPLEQFLGGFPAALKIHEQAGIGAHAKKNIFGGGQGRNVVELLINNLDAAFRCQRNGHLRIFFSMHRNGAAGGGVVACDGFDQRGFSCSVFPDQAVDFAFPELHGNIIQCLDAGKLLAEMICPQHNFS